MKAREDYISFAKSCKLQARFKYLDSEEFKDIDLEEIKQEEVKKREELKSPGSATFCPSIDLFSRKAITAKDYIKVID